MEFTRRFTECAQANGFDSIRGVSVSNCTFGKARMTHVLGLVSPTLANKHEEIVSVWANHKE